METELKNAVTFFKNEQAYAKLFHLFRKKYQSLGRIGGTVPIGTFTTEELDVLAGFFGVPAGQLQAKGSISFVLFEKQLANTRFAEVDLMQLLEAYFGEAIISNKQLRIEKEAQFRSFMLFQQRKHPILEQWFDYLLNIDGEGRWINSLAENDPDYFAKLVGHLAEALTDLPSEAERLPMFSQRITGNPHAFDLHEDLGKMFLHVLAVDDRKQEADLALVVPSDTEGINELLNVYHIYRDDLLNFVTVAGFYAETSSGERETWSAAVRQNSVQIIPLKELVPLRRVYPATGEKVWIVENSGVCSVLLDSVPDASIICTNGQFTLASLILLDLLVKDNYQLYYAGDFDPEGLSMAQRLLNRYPDNAALWQMDVTSYYRSNPVKKLTKERLEKLHAITHESLVAVVNEMRQTKMIGYQEALIDAMVVEINEE